MSADPEILAKTLARMYPHLSFEDRRALAEEFVRFINRGIKQKWNWQGLQLLGKGMWNSPFGNKLRELRESAGLTQVQAAAKVEWSQSKLNRIENGEVGVSWSDVRALIELYKVRDRALIDWLHSHTRRPGGRGPK